MSWSETAVSFDDEPLMVVDDNDNIVEYRTKVEVHQGSGLLHRAFSVFLFNGRGEILLQRRSAAKPLWPLFWSNSCCSHPRRGETYAVAVRRRLEEELGVAAETEFCFRFRYWAPFGSQGGERELCSVFVGVADGSITANRNEIADWRWTSVEALDGALANDADRYTPWLKLEWASIRAAHWPAVERYCARRSSTAG